MAFIACTYYVCSPPVYFKPSSVTHITSYKVTVVNTIFVQHRHNFYLFSTYWLNAELTDTDGQQSPPSLKYSAFTLPSNPQPGLPLCLVVFFSFKYVRKWVTAQFKTQVCPYLSPSFQIMYFLLKVRFTKRQGKTKRKRSSICWFISRMAATANAGLGDRRCPWTLKTV